MKIQVLQDQVLPDISDEVKEKICVGGWSMYKIDYSKNTEIQYMLSTDSSDYLLNSTGKPLFTLESRVGIKYISRISFEVKRRINYIEISL